MSDDRKKDHIKLALNSQTNINNKDFYYEPLLGAHPADEESVSVNFLGKKFTYPLWISSMTGGTEKAYKINKNLATIAGEFGFGMGLGSCRSLLESDQRIKDFDFKSLVGDQAFYINLGIAQVEQLIKSKSLTKITDLISKLQADGLIIHINPLQEWLQPEGDRIEIAPIESIKIIVNELDTNIIIKEVGQGFGPMSLESLMKLPIAAIDFSGFGGTNFSLIELNRHNAQEFDKDSSHNRLVSIGHTCSEMIEWTNSLLSSSNHYKCKDFIISGGIKNVLDGHAHQQKLNANSIIGMAASFLKHAEDLGALRDFAHMETQNYKLAKKLLRER